MSAVSGSGSMSNAVDVWFAPEPMTSTVTRTFGTGNGSTRIISCNLDSGTNLDLVVANFLGEQHTGGYSITVDKVINTEKYTQIIFSTHRPKPGSMRTMQITQPYIMIKVAKSKKPIIFEYVGIELK